MKSSWLAYTGHDYFVAEQVRPNHKPLWQARDLCVSGEQGFLLIFDAVLFRPLILMGAASIPLAVDVVLPSSAIGGGIPVRCGYKQPLAGCGPSEKQRSLRRVPVAVQGPVADAA